MDGWKYRWMHVFIWMMHGSIRGCVRMTVCMLGSNGGHLRTKHIFLHYTNVNHSTNTSLSLSIYIYNHDHHY